jgi:broad specificity phosphatase PhoE
MSAPKYLYVVRHGQTDYNKGGRIQGRGVDADLNEEGYRQARAFYRAFRHEPFDKVYVSALKRTYQTVQLFIENGIPWESHPELDEISWGIHEGQPSTKELWQDYRQVVQGWNSGDFDQKLPEGESAAELQARQRDFLEILDADPATHILICSHGRAMRSLLSLLTGNDLSNMDYFPHTNLSLYKLKQEGPLYTIKLFNYREHLDGLG